MRAKTEKEIRTEFLDQCHVISDYWATLPNQTIKQRTDGTAFSILSMIDGCSGEFPCSLELVTCVDPTDKPFDIGNENNWVENSQIINEHHMLHEEFFK